VINYTPSAQKPARFSERWP